MSAAPVRMAGFLTLAAQLGLRRGVFARVFALHVVATLCETLALVGMLPVIQYAQGGGQVPEGAAGQPVWQVVLALFGALGLEVSLPALLGLSFVLVLVRQALAYARQVYAIAVFERFNKAIRDRGFALLLGARFAFHDRVESGQLVADLTLELERANAGLNSLVQVYGAVSLFVVYGLTLLLMSPALTLAAVPVLALALVPLVVIQRLTAETGRQVSAANGRFTGFLVERGRAVRLIRLAHAGEEERLRLDRLTDAQRAAMQRQGRLLAAANVAIEPLVLLTAFGLFVLGIGRLGLTVEELGLFLLCLLRLLPAAKDFVRSRQFVLATEPSLRAIAERFAAMAREQEPPHGTARFPALQHAVVLDSVHFRYASRDDAALAEVSATLPARRLSAVVGPSGAGKSTLVDLLARLRQPDAGRILIDGTPIEAIEDAAFRAAVAVVPQVPQILGRTPSDHIAYGHPELDRAAIEAAAAAAMADGFIRALPQGYDTELGENATMLSGGQRQRLEIARAIARNARLLILDEPTSQLDPATERDFVATLDRLRARGDLTLVVIAHRPLTVAGADHLLVLRDGRVVAQGRPDQVGHATDLVAAPALAVPHG